MYLHHKLAAVAIPALFAGLAGGPAFGAASVSSGPTSVPGIAKPYFNHRLPDSHPIVRSGRQSCPGWGQCVQWRLHNQHVSQCHRERPVRGGDEGDLR